MNHLLAHLEVDRVRGPRRTLGANPWQRREPIPQDGCVVVVLRRRGVPSSQTTTAIDNVDGKKTGGLRRLTLSWQARKMHACSLECGAKQAADDTARTASRGTAKGCAQKRCFQPCASVVLNSSANRTMQLSTTVPATAARCFGFKLSLKVSEPSTYVCTEKYFSKDHVPVPGALPGTCFL